MLYFHFEKNNRESTATVTVTVQNIYSITLKKTNKLLSVGGVDLKDGTLQPEPSMGQRKKISKVDNRETFNRYFDVKQETVLHRRQTMASTILMCDPCSRHNKSSNGIKYCTDCEDSLCTECTSMHCAVQRISRHHLVDVSGIAGNAFNIKKNCIEHEDLSYEFYCSDHNCLVCQICIDNNHRNCGKIQTIDIPAKGCRSSLMLEDVTKDIASLLKSTKELVEESQKNKTRVGQIKAKVLKEIAKFRHDINDHIDQLERKLSSEVDIIGQKICKKVGNALCEANERQNFVENVWQQVDFILNMVQKVSYLSF
ncbi:unnamed protein product [Mytilus coruscus]|uniref:B box-type domain-containing protein n=1 Tax=Mytilus coruscus TaxID=42192 RepID=A0A6J8B060_MYTCO|nr:unnamed protein product [Mytilus coruscus]